MLRVLHVASFSGNIGDNANHAGFRRWFEGLAGGPALWTEFEIRDVYRGLRAFDEAFSAEANDHDLVVVGGGNYFELWVENSPTGTSFSISDEAWAALRVPVLFNALGVDAGQGVPALSRERFERFLAKVFASDQYLLSVRNDGSAATLSRVVEALPLDRVIRLPDAGFFADYPSSAVQGLAKSGPAIGINLAGDMLDRRFPGGERNSYEAFLDGFAGFLGEVDGAFPGARFVFFPHIFRDLKVYADLLAILPDTLRRRNCRVEPYDVGDDAAREIFSTYRRCDVVLGMRFHANVVAIGGDIPVIGLSCYDQIRLLYEEFDRDDLAVDVQKPAFEAQLLSLTRAAIERPDEARAQVRVMRLQAERMRQVAGEQILGWLQRRGLSQ